MKFERYKPVSAEDAQLHERRVMVAKDVIAQLKRGQYIPESGTYVGLSVHDRGMVVEAVREKRFDKVISKLNPCHVCAVGGALLSYVKLYDNVDVTTEAEVKFGALYLTGDACKITNSVGVLSTELGRGFVVRIEALFEQWEGWADVEFPKSWGKKGSKERMTAIMLDVVAREGEPPYPRTASAKAVHGDEA